MEMNTMKMKVAHLKDMRKTRRKKRRRRKKRCWSGLVLSDL